MRTTSHHRTYYETPSVERFDGVLPAHKSSLLHPCEIDLRGLSLQQKASFRSEKHLDHLWSPYFVIVPRLTHEKEEGKERL
jgi:hypothetical protein